MTNPYAGDCRRAVALIVSHARHEIDGMNALLQESVEVGRVTHLILAILDTYQSIIPILVTEIGMQALGQCVQLIAQPDTEDDDVRRAAAIVVAHSRDDDDAINAVIAETKQAARVTHLIVAVLNLYAGICPTIGTPLGITALSQTVLDLAARESAVDDQENTK